MTEKRFTMAEDEYTIEDNSKIISVMTREDILFTLNRLNDENEQLKKENKNIQNKIIRLLDYVEIKQCVTRTEIKKWWNKGIGCLCEYNDHWQEHINECEDFKELRE